jgi:Tfp pilus assembly protein PilF
MRLGIVQYFVFLAFFFLMVGCATKTGPLAVLPMTNPMAAQHNLEGIKFYNNGNWKEAEKRFKFSIREDSSLTEAHFNLALTQHKLGQHSQAKQHFKIAGELSPKNKDVVDSSIYRNHLGLSSIFERHISGGYRYE